METKQREQVAYEDWLKEAEELFGADTPGREWRFQCVSCGEVQTGQDFIEAGLTEEEASGRAYFSCIGRIVEGRGCDWSLGGFLRIHAREVIGPDGEIVPVFEFAAAADEPQ